jgi:maleylacetate reductase
MQGGTHPWLAQQRVHYGQPAAPLVSKEAQAAGARRVFVTTTRSLSGGRLVADCIAALGDAFAGKFDAIAAHSPREAVIEGAARLREAGADLVVAIGGGSVIDATKVMLQAVWYGIDTVAGLDAIVGGRHKGGTDPGAWDADPQSLRMLAVPTTLSAAEFSNVAGVTDTARRLKQMYVHPLAVPKAVILDPAATLDTPERLLLSTGMRSMDHAVERWCAIRPLPFGDALSLHAMKMLAAGLPRLKASPQDLQARSDCQVAMWLSLLPQSAGVPFGASHGIGYILGGAYGVPHGETSCVTLPSVLEWNEPVNAERQKAVAQALGRPGERAGPALREFVRSLGLPWRLRDVGIERGQLPEIAGRYDGTGPISTNPRPVSSPADIVEILELAW